MSTTDPARPLPRRAILAGGMGIVTTPLALAPASASSSTRPDPAETAFLRWLSLVGDNNAGRGVPENATDEEVEIAYVPIAAAEAAIHDGPDTPAKALVLALHELAYRLDECRDWSIGELLSHADEGKRFALHVARCLRAYGSDRLAVLTADLFEPDRLAGDTALFHAYAGEA